MQRVILDRLSTGNAGTFGQYTLPDRTQLFSGELPWRDNAVGLSCIPEGEYECRWGPSRRFGMVYEITGVPGRSRILIHNGNYCGDVTLGLKSHVQGCQLTGLARGLLAGQLAILNSRLALRLFNEALMEEPFILEVRNNGLF